jgi:tetratricopeptide (TPR) repeat protein
VSTVDTDDLVDRGLELEELSAALGEASTGRGRLVLIEGPAGIGKSRLLAEARRLTAGLDLRVLTARGSPLEKEYGLGAVRQLFEAVVADPTTARALLSGAAASAAPVFDLAASPEPSRSDTSLATLHGLYWLTVNLSARTPLLIAVDDVQWCDSGSLRFLAYLVRRVEELPVIVVATRRTGEAHEDDVLLAELAHDPATILVRPGPLTAGGVATLVRTQLRADADAAFVTACHRTTSGNPLLLRQLLRALQAEGVPPDASHADIVTAIGSRAISSLVLMRLGRMPATATTVARAVAVLGDGAALPAVATLAGLPEDETATVVAALARAEVLRDAYPLSFVHPLVADAVYRDLPPGQRQLQHERAARILRDTGAAAEQVAAHLLQVPERGARWVVEVLRAAATTAANRGAPDAAARYLNRALVEPPEPDERAGIVLELGRLETMSDGQAAITHLREAYQLVGDPIQRAEVAQMLARTLVFTGSAGSATAFARRAVDDLPAELVDERQGLRALASIGGYMHDVDPRVWRVDEPVIVGDGPGARMLAAALAWEALLDGVDRQRSIDLARFALAGGTLLDVDAGLLWVAAGNVLHWAGEDAMPSWIEALARAQKRGSMFAALATHLWRGVVEWERGELATALASVTLSYEQSRIWGDNVGLTYSGAVAVEIRLDQGDLVGARRALEEVRRAPRVGEGFRLFGEAEAGVLIAEGRYEEALHTLDAIAPILRAVRNPVWRRQGALRARALAALGDQAGAVALLQEELRAARAWGTPHLVGRTLRLLGEITADADHLREAVDLLAGSRARLEYARALAALGERTADDALLRQAYDLADRCGAQGLRSALASRLGVVQ